MAKRNDRARKKIRSSKRACKPEGKWITKEAAGRWLDRLAETEPLNALGMRAYPCPQCGFYHIGRGQSR